jgi:hypothetical protein
MNSSARRPGKLALGLFAGVFLLLVVSLAVYMQLEPEERAIVAHSPWEALGDSSKTTAPLRASELARVAEAEANDAEWIRVNAKLEEAREKHKKVIIELARRPADHGLEFVAKETAVTLQKTLVDRLNAFREDQILDALGMLGIEDGTVQKTVEALRQVQEKEVALLQAGAKPGHSQLEATQGAIRVYQRVLHDTLASLRRSAQTKLEAETEAYQKAFDKRMRANVGRRSALVDQTEAELAAAEKTYREAEAKRPAGQIRDWRPSHRENTN